MTPSAWAKGGAGVTIRWIVADTSLGPMLVAATDKGLCRVSFDEDDLALRERFPRAEIVPGGAALADLAARVVAAVESPERDQDLPIDVRGTAFQEAVWQALRDIPAGETRSYSELAAAAGKPKAGTCRRYGVRRKHHRGHHPLPPRAARRRLARRLRLWPRPQAAPPNARRRVIRGACMVRTI